MYSARYSCERITAPGRITALPYLWGMYFAVAVRESRATSLFLSPREREPLVSASLLAADRLSLRRGMRAHVRRAKKVLAGTNGGESGAVRYTRL